MMEGSSVNGWGLARALAMLMVTMLIGCSGSDEASSKRPDPLDYALGEDGPFRAGFRSEPLTYTPAGESAERNIVVNVWYPTEQEQGEPAVYEGVFQDFDVFLDATLALPAYEGGFPVLVHSHGSQAFGGTSSTLMRHFATHGWVVVAPDHTGSTLLTETKPRPLEHYLHRPQDISATLDWLEERPSEDPLFGLTDSTRVAMTGHSFGGYTVYATGGASFDRMSIQTECDADAFAAPCQSEMLDRFDGSLADLRVAALIPLGHRWRDSFFGDAGYESVSLPVCYLTGSDDQRGQAEFFAQANGLDLTWVDIEGACHEMFGVGKCTNLSDDLGFPIVNTYALAFARRHILGDERDAVTGVIDGSTSVSELATLQKK